MSFDPTHRIALYDVAGITAGGAVAFPMIKTGAATEGNRRFTVYGPKSILSIRINDSLGASTPSETSFFPLSDLANNSGVLPNGWFIDLRADGPDVNVAVIYERIVDLMGVA